MADTLQNLLDKINEKGVKEAEAAAAEIIAAAEKEAAEIRDKARADANALVAEAAEQAEALERRSDIAIRQTARDIILELQVELQQRLERAVSGAAEQAMTPEFMATLIRDMTTRFVSNPAEPISVQASLKDAPALEARLKAALQSSLRTSPRVFADSGIRGGFEVEFQEDSGRFDFTVEAVTGLVADYIDPKMGKILKGE